MKKIIDLIKKLFKKKPKWHTMWKSDTWYDEDCVMTCSFTLPTPLYKVADSNNHYYYIDRWEDKTDMEVLDWHIDRLEGIITQHKEWLDELKKEKLIRELSGIEDV